MRGFDPTSFPGFSPTRPYGASERERPWLGLVTWLQNKIYSITQRFLVPLVPWTPGTMSPFFVLNAMKTSLQIMRVAAYASETNKLTLAITHTTGLFIIRETSEVFACCWDTVLSPGKKAARFVQRVMTMCGCSHSENQFDERKQDCLVRAFGPRRLQFQGEPQLFLSWITSRCSGKWARTQDQRPDPGDGGNRAYLFSAMWIDTKYILPCYSEPTADIIVANQSTKKVNECLNVAQSRSSWETR